MDKVLLQEVFLQKVHQFIAKASGKTILFFRGFSTDQIAQLISHSNAILQDDSLLSDGHLNLAGLNDRWLDLLTAMATADRPLVGFFEELLVIRDSLSRVRADHIIVVENNMLTPWTPSCIPQTQALALFDALQEEREIQDEQLLLLAGFYMDVKLLDNQALLLPLSPDNPGIEYIPFWAETPDPVALSECEQIVIGGAKDWKYRLDLLNGDAAPAIFLQHGDKLDLRQKGLASALTALGVDCCFDDLERYTKKEAYDETAFLPLLRRYWGAGAAFRPLLFYHDPDRSRETETISQGVIIAEIAAQCEKALNGDRFSNVFITAPTGSGKSILFQLPALYLAEKYNLVTIVISPLIALMNDQVDQLQRERGITTAAYINSTMSIEERMEVISQIHRGEKSLLYLAPELLLTTHLQTFLGGRRIGMIVIDEAHTVTSWGRDFRSDYWFLGDFLKKVRRDGMSFPVLCLTATAVYSGEDDVVNDTIQELGLEETIIHLGNVKRTNIVFDIVHHEKDKLTRRVEDEKIDLTLTRVRDLVERQEKVLAYFPYRSQVDQAYGQLSKAEHIRMRRYHGQMATAERKLVEQDYKNGTAMGLLCTKAFGMGIDVGDIRHVVHFAPTGTLADYVQEIGRAARSQSIQGTAHIDFFPSDLRYVRVLNGISEMRQFQLREMLKKLCQIYQMKNRRNLLISADTFSYLFKEDELETRTKSGLLLLAKDLSNKYSFPVLIVRPKPMLAKNYVNVPFEIEEQFLKKYGAYAKLQKGSNNRIVSSGNLSRASDVRISSDGNTYLVDMAEIWENCFPDRAFGMFKMQFFSEKLRSRKGEYSISPRVLAEIRYHDDFGAVDEKLFAITQAIVKVFANYKNAEKKQFTRQEFENALKTELDEKVIAHEKVSMLLEVFSENVDETAQFTQVRRTVRVLRKRKQVGSEETTYFVSNPAYAQIPSLLRRLLNQCAPNQGGNTFHRYYPQLRDKAIEIMPLLRVLELLDLASYEIRGGEKSEVFIRINDPSKLLRLANENYYNSVLHAIHNRHRRNERLLLAFFLTEMTTEERWHLIEEYFLGNEAYFSQVLGLQPDA